MIVAGLLLLAVVSGALGLGVAFAAVPFLSFFLGSLVHEVQPLSLLLNGATAMAAAAAFALAGNVQWRRALPLAALTAAAAPLGSLLAQDLSTSVLWGVYLAAVAYLAYRLFRPAVERPAGRERFLLAAALAVPIAVLSGMLGVGPGFLLLPTLVIAGFAIKTAAGITAVAVIPPSFTALVPHLPSATWHVQLTLALLVAGVLGSYAGAHLSSRYATDARLKQGFGLVIVLATAYRVITL